MRKTSLFVLSFIYLFICLFLFIPSVSAVYTSDVNVSALIGGEGTFSLYGYTSPDSTVSISSQGIYDETRSDNTGYFLFIKKPTSLFQQDLCLSVQDNLGRISTPICIPSLPSGDNIVIGPIILPPTVSLNTGSLFIGEEPILSGQTIPNTNVKLSLFTDTNKAREFIALKNFVKPVEAYTIPRINIISDSKGNYSVALPSSQVNYYRMFVQSIFQESYSPKSNTLHLNILPFWMYFIQLFTFLWGGLQKYLIDVIIISQIVSIGFYLLYRYLKPYHIFDFYKKRYPLALRPSHELVVEDIPLMKKEKTS
jgi:hypothetical protein